MIIRLKVFEQTLSIVEKKSVPRKGSKDYLALQFTFSSDWKDLDKLCYLQHGEVSQPIDVVDNLVEVPEWFTEQDSFEVTLFGKSGTQEVPTNVVSLRLGKSNTLWEQDAPEPQPSWLAKIIDLNNHPPIFGDNGYWLLWDTDIGAYVESDLPLPEVSGGGAVDDVQVNGESVVADGVAKIPLVKMGSTGVVKLDAFMPFTFNAGALRLANADENELTNPRDGYSTNRAITAANYRLAVKLAMCDGKGAPWTDKEKTAVRHKLTIIKNALDDGIAVAGAQYYLGERKTVSIVLPDDVEPGDMITVSWYNGDTAATLSITGGMLEFDYTPSANTRSEINALWDGTYWAVLGNEMAVPSEVTA